MSVKSRIRLELFIRLTPGYAIFFISIFTISVLYSFIAGSAIGMPVLFVAFISLRYRYKDNATYHNMSTKKCIALSIALFAVSAFPLIVLNMKISLLSSMPIAIGMTWFLYVLGLKDKAERELEESKKDTFNLDTCTEEELRERCRQRFKRDVEYKTERAIKHFILRLPHEQIDVNVEQSKKERYRMRKLLE
mgnify:CR=1 FL=1